LHGVEQDSGFFRVEPAVQQLLADWNWFLFVIVALSAPPLVSAQDKVAQSQNKRLDLARAGETIGKMKNRDVSRHPGPWRMMKVDSEFAGLLLAVAFLVMGAVGLDIGKWFVLGALVLGVVVALLLRLTRKAD
jgi:hypothetical protein